MSSHEFALSLKESHVKDKYGVEKKWVKNTHFWNLLKVAREFHLLLEQISGV